jgi:hypothetical protein
MVVISELLILTLLNMQANDLPHISFRPSSPPIMLSYLYELHKVQNNDLAPASSFPSPLPILYPHSFELDNVKATIHTCLAFEIKVCEEESNSGTFEEGTFELKYCLVQAHAKCLKRHKIKMASESSH